MNSQKVREMAKAEGFQLQASGRRYTQSRKWSLWKIGRKNGDGVVPSFHNLEEAETYLLKLYLDRWTFENGELFPVSPAAIRAKVKEMRHIERRGTK